MGSLHSLVVASTIQPNPQAPTVYTFNSWVDSAETLLTPAITVTANASVTTYIANFTATYTFNAIVSSMCGSAPCPTSPGTIFVNGIALGALIPPLPQALPAGSVETLLAMPNSGYAFVGWTPGPNQALTGVQDIVTLTAPVTAVANFVVAVNVTLNTVPQGLQLLADTVPTTAPYTASLGWGTQHTVAAISPQKDLAGNLWVFSSWSDNGAISHTYTVPQSNTPQTLTATFTPAVLNTFLTAPSGLSLTVDGRTNWNVWNFAWSVGSSHTFSAPSMQTDSQGRLWKFTGWSNGGPQSQSVVIAASPGNTFTAMYQQLGQLTVTSTLPGVPLNVNGAPCTTPCSLQPPLGTTLTVSAPASLPVGPNARQDLLGWSNGAGPGDLVVAAPAQATTITATYHLMNYLATASNPAGAATWKMVPASPDGFYDSHSAVNITLVPLAGYQFRNWSGDLNGIAPFGTVQMNQPRSVTALFSAVAYLPDGAVSNGAGPTPSSAVAPGSAISIFGANLADDVKENLAATMPQALDGVTVAIGGRLLPLYFVSPGQINAQLPADLPLGKASLVVTTPEQTQVTTTFTIAQDAPGLFALTLNDKAFVLAFHQDGKLVTEAAPAQAGELLTVFGTGFGPTTPSRPEGLAVPKTPSFTVTDPVSVQVGTASYASQSAYAMPGAVGIDVVQFLLGSDAPSGGDFPLTVTINKIVSNSVLLPIQ